MPTVPGSLAFYLVGEMNLPAGMELDALVAEKVMGDPKPTLSGLDVRHKGHTIGSWMLVPASGGCMDWLPRGYSGSWEVMRLVVERMRELGFDLVIESATWMKGFPKGGYCVWWQPNEKEQYRGDSDTLPHAVCLAALSAVAK